MLRKTFKLGKKLCFPDVPSVWITRAVERMVCSQPGKPKSEIMFPFPGDDEYYSEDIEACEPQYYSLPSAKYGKDTHFWSHVNYTHVDDFLKTQIPKYSDSISKMVAKSNNIIEKGKSFDVINLLSSCSDKGYLVGINGDIIDVQTLKEKNILKYWSFHLLYSIRRAIPSGLDNLIKVNNTMVASPIEKGKFYGVLPWLSSYVGNKKGYLVRVNGEKVEVESLVGKNILVYCIFVPVFWLSFEAYECRDLPFACSRLFSTNGAGDGDYEVVIVPKMRSNWANDEEAFNHFLSDFPSSWLTIPFSDTLRRDFACKSLGLISDPVCLALDQNHKVLMHGSPSDVVNADRLVEVGTSRRDFGIGWCEANLRLNKILDSKFFDFVYNIARGDQKLSISELNEKLVGLYLCVDGRHMTTVDLIHKECKARNQEFEVVLVYLPYTSEVNPQLFQEAVNLSVRQLKVSDTWWVSPFDDFVSRRLWQDFGMYMVDQDQLIIIGPQNRFVDPFGMEVFLNWGINAYPFTRARIVERELESLRGLNLESLLVFGSQNHLLYLRPSQLYGTPGVCDFDKVHVSELRGKTVLVYADSLQSLDYNLYALLLKWYCNFKDKKTRAVPFDFEVVFFNLDDDADCVPAGPAGLMPWLLCPFNPQHAAFVHKKLLRGICPAIVAFGRNGKIISMNAEQLLESYGPDDFPFDDDSGLRKEVIARIKQYSDYQYNEMYVSDIV